MLAKRYPLAICRFVVAVVVDALDGATIRARPHVCDEVCEGPPSVADFDAASAIAFVGVGVWVLATLPHRDPCVENGIAIFSIAGDRQKVGHGDLHKGAVSSGGSDVGASARCDLSIYRGGGKQ